MEKICKNCRFWGAYYENACDRIGMGAMSKPHIDVFVHDDSGLEVNLITNPEFGCTLFEESDKSE